MHLTDDERAAAIAAKEHGELCPLCRGSERTLVNDAAPDAPRARRRDDDAPTMKVRPVPCFCTTAQARGGSR